MKEGVLQNKFTEIEETVKEYYKQLYTNKLDDLDKMYKFLEKLPKLTQEKIYHPNRSVTSKETELVMKKTTYKEKPKPTWLHQ